MRTVIQFSAISLLIFLQSCRKDEPKPPVITTAAVTEISYTSAISGGEITDEGGAPIVAQGICWNTSPAPTTSNSRIIAGGGPGPFTGQLTPLIPNTLYYVKAYATNSAGTGYGEEISFKTIQVTAPDLTTANITSVAITTAVSGGNITAENGATVTERGVCWSISHNPDISDSKTNDGSGTGVFSSTLTGLAGSTTYYVRSYATNSGGTSYGNEVSFTTNPPVAPALKTNTITSLTANSFTSGGTITSDGGATVTSRGICWSSGRNPTVSDDKYTEGTGNGSYSGNVTGLSPNSVYYIRAYATNIAGTSYGNEVAVCTYAVMDIEGNGYHSVTIGGKTWMKENLRATKYSNGDPVGTTTPVTKDISAESSPKYQWAYDGIETNAEIYGRLYTWYAVSDSRNLCPAGWHVATASDWNLMINWLMENGYSYDGSIEYGGFNKVGLSLADTVLWISSGVPGSIGNKDYPSFRNKTGFSALPSGTRKLTGLFLGMGSGTSWWTPTETISGSGTAWASVMSYNGTHIIVNGHLKMEVAEPVRCVKD